MISAPPDPYGGDLFTRGRLTGDWGGVRRTLANRGLDFDLFATQFYQGVTRGGREQAFEYGGKVDALLNVDGHKLGLWQGLFVNLHAETRFGRDVNDIDGLLLPSNIAMSFPEANANITSLTGLKITQALSENFAVYLGKINTLDEYPVRYNPELVGPAARGGFLTTSLSFNPIVARTVPYSAAGVGFAVLKDLQPLFSLTVFDPEERATTGADKLFATGAVIVPDLTIRTTVFGLPGVYDFSGTYSSARYRSFDPAAYFSRSFLQSLRARAPVTPLETGSWSIAGNFYQSLWADPGDTTRNWGVFAQLGLSDGNPNPLRYVASGGVGGRSVIPRRQLDTFGVGYYYLGLSDEFMRLARPFLPQRDGYGVELFYNCALTPWCRLTGDLQVARPSTVAIDTALIAGLRLQVRF